MRRGAEADIYLTEWYGRPAISKVRTARTYRHKLLDDQIRRYRTIHEAQIMSQAKLAGVRTPYIYFVDPVQAEIIMEYVQGTGVKDAIKPELCRKMGEYAAMLHRAGIIHGDLTTSNFMVVSKSQLVLLDFGLAYYSERTEDMAVDIRLIKEVFSSAHVKIFKPAFGSFVQGYLHVMGKKESAKVLENVAEIERRGRYARFQV